MKILKKQILAYITFLLLCLPFGAGQAVAQESVQSGFAVSRIGLVDMGFVLRNAAGTAKVRDLLDAKRDEFQAEFAERERQLFDRERELQLKKSVMSQSAYNAAVQEFQAEVSTTQQEIQQRRQSLDQAFQDAQNALRELGLDIITDIAREQQLDLVLTRDNTIIFRQELNITQEVLSRLDERTKNARLIVTEDAAGAGIGAAAGSGVDTEDNAETGGTLGN